MRDLTLPQPVLFVLHRLIASGFDAFVVGGAVRDVILSREVTDWDITTNATPEEIQTVFPKSFYDNTFGTVGVASGHLFELMKKNGWIVAEEILQDQDWQKQVLEITTYRTEFGYSDRRRPDKIEWGQTIEEDLSRRDFTVNSMALTVTDSEGGDKGNLAGLLAFSRREPELTLETEIIDPYHGQKDVELKLIRAVRDPQERFAEDALRMMRAIRFGAQLGFAIEPKTFEAISGQAHLIEHVSWERIAEELLKILASDFPADGMALLHNAGLLEYIIPEMIPMIGVEQGGHHIYDVWTHSLESLKHCPSTDPIVRMAALLHDVGKPKTARAQGPRGVTFYGHEVVGARMVEKIGQRLRLSKKQVQKLVTLVRWHMFTYDREMTDAAIRRFIKRVGLENINDMMLLRVGDRKGGGSKATSWRLRELQQRIGEQLYEPMSLKDLKVNGHDLMEELKMKPGPEMGKVLNQLFDEVMEDTSKNDRDYLLSRAKELISK